jgi:hypothetical protein
MATTSAASQAQVASLLQALLSRGLGAKDALPTVKALVEAKIFSLDEVTADSSLPSSISVKLQNKLRPKRKRGSTSANNNNNTSNKRSKTKVKDSIEFPPVTDQPPQILVNRSPVLTLWAAIVAMTIFPKMNDNGSLTLEEALSFGSALASITAKGKGEHLGIFTPSATVETSHHNKNTGDDDNDGSRRTFSLMGTTLQIVSTSAGLRALGADSKEQEPEKTWKLLKQRFGTALGHVAHEMRQAAKKAGDGLEATAFDFYIHIRPNIPSGTKGWGAHGHLDINKIQNFYHDDFK